MIVTQVEQDRLRSHSDTTKALHDTVMSGSYNARSSPKSVLQVMSLQPVTTQRTCESYFERASACYPSIARKKICRLEDIVPNFSSPSHTIAVTNRKRLHGGEASGDCERVSVDIITRPITMSRKWKTGEGVYGVRKTATRGAFTMCFLKCEPHVEMYWPGKPTQSRSFSQAYRKRLRESDPGTRVFARRMLEPKFDFYPPTPELQRAWDQLVEKERLRNAIKARYGTAEFVLTDATRVWEQSQKRVVKVTLSDSEEFVGLLHRPLVMVGKN